MSGPVSWYECAEPGCRNRMLRRHDEDMFCPAHNPTPHSILQQAQEAKCTGCGETIDPDEFQTCACVRNPPARKFLTDALAAIDGRASVHGAKRGAFEAYADLWNGYMRATGRADMKPFGAVDVALMMGLLKIGRTTHGTHNPDDYTDLAGYGACAGEIASEIAAEVSDA